MRRIAFAALLGVLLVAAVWAGWQILRAAADGRGSSAATVAYVVQAGDTCMAIASRYHVTVQEIAERNRIPADCSSILPGEILEIPVP